MFVCTIKGSGFLWHQATPPTPTGHPLNEARPATNCPPLPPTTRPASNCRVPIAAKPFPNPSGSVPYSLVLSGTAEADGMRVARPRRCSGPDGPCVCVVVDNGAQHWSYLAL
jgi:hypothetical protein